MTQINRQLTVWKGSNDIQLHLTDPYGHVNGVVSLSLEECRQLGEALAALQSIAVEAVMAESESVIDWSRLTHAESVAEVKERFNAHLNREASESVLVAAAGTGEKGQE